MFYNVVLVVCVFSAVALAKPQDKVVQLLRYENEGVREDNSWKWSFAADNGIEAEEEGHIKGSDETAGPEVLGSAQWISPEGELVQLRYLANEEGYQPSGSHLPTPPPTPEAILKALAWNAAHPQEEEKKPAPGSRPSSAVILG